jgi:lipoate---protein ligase
MKCLDLSFPTPEDNLACDEVLLDACEAGELGETLRFWESPKYFVVVGYGNAVQLEVNQPSCDAKGIPILRRCTGGGTVVQGPGCLNYSLVLEFTDEGPLRNITSANQFIMEQNRHALATLMRKSIAVRGHTDLAIEGVKFSGNAQRRRKRTLLFHGSLLLNFDLSLISELLPMPSRQPDYRLSRVHGNFLMNASVAGELVKDALRKAWHAHESLAEVPHELVSQLARGKYATREWNFKF